MTVTWSIASGIILHHRSNAYELSIYCSSLIYFSVAIVTITTKHQKYYFCYHYHYYHITLLLNTLLQILSYLGVVELTTQLLILENILWLPLCRIYKFGFNTLPSKTVAIPYTCGLSRSFGWSPEKNKEVVAGVGGVPKVGVVGGRGEAWASGTVQTWTVGGAAWYLLAVAGTCQLVDKGRS